jgi:pyruvate,orthophosphate dikinase
MAGSVQGFVSAVRNGRLSVEDAILACRADELDALLRPTVDRSGELTIVARGLVAAPGAATGRLAFSPDEADALTNQGHNVLLFCETVHPEDLCVFDRVAAVLSTHEDSSSHAAIVARVKDKPFVTGLELTSGGAVQAALRAHQSVQCELTLDANRGELLLGRRDIHPARETPDVRELLSWIDRRARLAVHANADTPDEAEVSLRRGATGVEPRTEYMFYEPRRLRLFRSMLFSPDVALQRASMRELAQIQAADFDPAARSAVA